MKLTLVRGLPGSGKSTLAEILAHSLDRGYHLETDQFWGEEYKFDISRIQEAYQWCQDETGLFLYRGRSVVVSNTFTTKKELRPYFEIAKEFSIVPQVILCQGQYGNIHNVPQNTLDRMKARFEYDISELYNA